ncbi:MAG: YdcP family protein [Lachnospiraceae bacterium]|nr:YdcP family protein [Lachnospiraceae bacterium]
MKLKYVVPNMEETFGKLFFGGEKEVTSRRVNGVSRVVNRTYELFSSKQRKESVLVELPASAGEKKFVFDEDIVELVNPRITVEGRNINGRGITNYTLYADDMKKVN